METEPKRNDNFLAMSILIAAVVISGSLIYTAGGRPAAPASQQQAQVERGGTPPDVSDRDVILGEANAPVTLIEYGDYQCPFCARFFLQTEPLLRDEYIKTGKVRMVYRNLAFLGQESVDAAEATECAKDQGKFWQYHDALYTAEHADDVEGNGNLNRALFLKLAGEAKLDTGAFTECYDSGKYESVVNKQTQDAQSIGVNSTPTTFVNGEKVLGAQPYATFTALIDSFD